MLTLNRSVFLFSLVVVGRVGQGVPRCDPLHRHATGGQRHGRQSAGGQVAD